MPTVVASLLIAPQNVLVWKINYMVTLLIWCLSLKNSASLGMGEGVGRSAALLTAEEQGWAREAETGPPACGDESRGPSDPLKPVRGKLLAHSCVSILPTELAHPGERAVGRMSAGLQLQLLLPTLHSSTSRGDLLSSLGLSLPIYSSGENLSGLQLPGC